MALALSVAIERVVPSQLISSATGSPFSSVDPAPTLPPDAKLGLSVEPTNNHVNLNKGLFGFDPDRFNLKRAKRCPSVKFECFINPNRRELEHLDPDFKPPPAVPESSAFSGSEDSQEGTPEAYRYNWALDACQPFLFISTLPPLPECYLRRPYALPKKTRSSPKITLVLDLDETLVHCNFQGMAEPDIVFPLHFGPTLYTVGSASKKAQLGPLARPELLRAFIFAKIRPHYKEFIEHVSRRFEVVVFTASTKAYANRLLNLLDPTGKHIKFRLFRETCAVVQGTYLKDLTVLGRDLATTIIVDNQPQVFGYQLSNGIPIPSFYDDKDDKSLLQLIPVLEDLALLDDVRPGIARRFGFQAQVDAFPAPMPPFAAELSGFDIFSPAYP
ncbi:hypothetical protein L0F63_000789 [Massospora cicadina]|nr:hypothetical protein L0F63_000789 [Massospora cicadina]